MPININDRRLASLYNALEARRATDPSAQIDDSQVVKILAEVGDRWFNSSSKIFGQLTAPGITREAQVALIQKGMTAGEKSDLTQILDSGSVPIADSARNFLEAVIGRQSVLPGGALRIIGDQKNGISGTVSPGASIEAINITTAPGGRLHMDDTMEIAKADASGRFTGLMPDMQEGDLIRMRARNADGTVGNWVTIKAQGLASADTRNAVVSMQRIGLTAESGDKVAVLNINASRQVSEPGAQLQFTNTRTGEKTKVTLNETGSFPDGFKLNGKAGDVFSVAASDGTNNTSFASEVGRVTVPGGDTNNTTDLIKDPALHKDELNPDGTPRFEKKRFTGPIFKDGGAAPTDVMQGQIGNCYMPAAAAAMAHTDPEALQRAIRDNGDGTYTVTLKEKDWATGQFRDVEIKVDGDLYVRSWGAPLYGAANGSDKGQRTMEMWWPLLEKAFATWKGSYDSIGNGGMANEVMEAVLGAESRDVWVSPSNMDRTWDSLKKAVDSDWPVAAGTHGESQEALYTNTGVYANHAYTVLGYEEQNGERFVKLRNPWGESEPHGNGANDGVFLLKLQDFSKLYQTLMWAEG